MKKELLKGLIDLFNNQERIENFVEENLKQLFVESILEPSFDGWSYPIVSNEKGELYYYQAMSNTNMPFGVYTGDEVVVYKLPAFVEASQFMEGIEGVDALTEDEILKQNIEFSWDNYDRDNIIEEITDCIGKLIEMENN